MHACMHACMGVCMYVCMYVCKYIYTNTYIHGEFFLKYHSIYHYHLYIFIINYHYFKHYYFQYHYFYTLLLLFTIVIFVIILLLYCYKCKRVIASHQRWPPPNGTSTVKHPSLSLRHGRQIVAIVVSEFVGRTGRDLTTKGFDCVDAAGSHWTSGMIQWFSESQCRD